MDNVWDQAIQEFRIVARELAGHGYGLCHHFNDGFYATARDSHGRTMLHVLCDLHYDYGLAKEVERVLSHGADPCARDARGRTPLHEICTTEGGGLGYEEDEVIDLLLRAGAEIDARDQSGRTPLLQALDFIHGDGGYDDDDLEEEQEFTSQVPEHLIARGAAVNIRDNDGVSPLHMAVAQRDLVAVRLLIAHGASPWAKATGDQMVILENRHAVVVPAGARPRDVPTTKRIQKLLDESECWVSEPPWIAR